MSKLYIHFADIEKVRDPIPIISAVCSHLIARKIPIYYRIGTSQIEIWREATDRDMYGKTYYRTDKGLLDDNVSCNATETMGVRPQPLTEEHILFVPRIGQPISKITTASGASRIQGRSAKKTQGRIMINDEFMWCPNCKHDVHENDWITKLIKPGYDNGSGDWEYDEYDDPQCPDCGEYLAPACQCDECQEYFEDGVCKTFQKKTYCPECMQSYIDEMPHLPDPESLSTESGRKEWYNNIMGVMNWEKPSSDPGKIVGDWRGIPVIRDAIDPNYGHMRIPWAWVDAIQNRDPHPQKRDQKEDVDPPLIPYKKSGQIDIMKMALDVQKYRAMVKKAIKYLSENSTQGCPFDDLVTCAPDSVCYKCWEEFLEGDENGENT